MREIVSVVDYRLSLGDSVEAQCQVAARKSGNLRHAILKNTFEGNLVPQDPTDEPASVLLERQFAEIDQDMFVHGLVYRWPTILQLTGGT